MKKLLVLCFFLFPLHAMAANEITLNYSLPPGGSANYLSVHASNCIPTVLSLESGSVNVAVWPVSIGTHTSVIKVFNIGPTTETSAAKLRLGTCQ